MLSSFLTFNRMSKLCNNKNITNAGLTKYKLGSISFSVHLSHPRGSHKIHWAHFHFVYCTCMDRDKSICGYMDYALISCFGLVGTFWLSFPWIVSYFYDLEGSRPGSDMTYGKFIWLVPAYANRNSAKASPGKLNFAISIWHHFTLFVLLFAH